MRNGHGEFKVTVAITLPDRHTMAIFKLQKAKGHDIINGDKFYAGAKNRVVAGRNKYGTVTGLTKEQEAYYEKELGLEAGKLARTSSFWDDWNVPVNARGTDLNDEHALDALAIIVLKQRENVGLTLDDSKKAGTEYILTSEDHDARVAIDKRTYKKKAFMLFGNMTPEDMKNFLLAKNRKVTGMSPDAIEKLVGDMMELSPKDFLATAEDDDKDLKVFINELVHCGALTKNGSAFLDTASNETLAFGPEAMVIYFKNPENQTAYVQYQKELARKKKAK